MVYGLQDVVNQRRMIDDSEAGRRLQGGDARQARRPAGLGRGHRLPPPAPAGHFGEASQRPAATATTACTPSGVGWHDAARKLLSTIYRVHEASQLTFGVGHLMDVVRGKLTDKVRQYGHEKLSTFNLGAQYSEAQLRAVLRQLLALGRWACSAWPWTTATALTR